MAQAATQTAPTQPEASIQPQSNPGWEHAVWLPCTVSVEVSIPHFTPNELMQLEPNSIVRTQWAISANVPMKVNGELIAWCEFEVVANRLAIRLTELAG